MRIILFSVTHEPSQYHPAASSFSSPPVNSPLSPSNMNSQQITTVNNFAMPSAYGPVLNSNVNDRQQYHRPLLKDLDDNSNKGTMNSYDEKENKRN